MTTLYERFLTPPREYSPVPIWWWSGERLDPERLRWQLERFLEGGIYNVVIMNLAPTGPLFGASADDPAFFSPEWWTVLGGVCADAEELGISIWLYDQIGFSGANLQADLVRDTPAHGGQSLERVSRVFDGDGELSCPAGGIAVAGFITTPVEGSHADDTVNRRVPLDGQRLTWSATGQFQATLYYTVERSFDYFSNTACKDLLDLVHGSYEAYLGEYLGSTIVGTFQDELPSMPTWSRHFAAAFRDRHGYDILDVLPSLWDDHPESKKVRRDYHTARADLAEESFFKPLFDWHEEHGLVCGFDQQGPARAGEPIATVTKYADYLRTHRWYTAPGTDHHGEAKIHSSLAHLYVRPRTWIESFHSSGWGGTLEETFDWLVPWLGAGANLYDPHAVYYSTRGSWWEWAPPATDWRQPYWRHHAEFARAISRLCSVLSAGHHVCDTALLFPTTTIQAGTGLINTDGDAQAAHDMYLELVGRMTWFDVKPGILNRLNRDYDILDDDSIQRGTVEQAELVIGAERYRTVILPNTVVLESRTAAVLNRFVNNGGRLIAVGGLPRHGVGSVDQSDPLGELISMFENGRALRVERPEDLLDVLSNEPARVIAPHPTLLRQYGDTTLLFVPAIFPRTTKMPDEGQSGQTIGAFPWVDVEYEFEPTWQDRTFEVTVYGVEGPPRLWEPFSGSVRRLDYTQLGDQCVKVSVPFLESPVALLVWGESEPSAAIPPNLDETAASSASGREVIRIQELDDPWLTQLETTLDNRWGDFAWPPDTPIPPVEAWHFRHRREEYGADSANDWHKSGYDDGPWKTVHATFGPQGHQAGPASASQLPEPASSLTEWRSQLRENRTDEWSEIAYSRSRGIYKDPIHRSTLGPKGRVPEEFLDFGTVRKGEAVQYRTTLLVSEAIDTHLVLGAAARKEVWLDSRELGMSGNGYIATAEVALTPGSHLLEFRLHATTDSSIRAHFAFVDNLFEYRRPEWMRIADGPNRDTVVSYEKTVELDFSPTTSRIQVGCGSPAQLYINGTEVGRQGGFDPYSERSMFRLQPYDLSDHVAQGEFHVRVDISDLGESNAVLIDGVFANQGRQEFIMSDDSWRVSRDGTPASLQFEREQVGDPAWSHLWTRPHPLPDAHWLGDDPPRDCVRRIETDADGGSPTVEWLRFLIPPGASRMFMHAAGSITLYHDGSELEKVPDTVSEGLWVDLPASRAGGSLCVLRIETVPGFKGGGILRAPIAFEMSEGGLMNLGDWGEQGLGAYSGGVVYTKEFDLDPSMDQAHRITLELGSVRGTAELTVNGTPVGTRVLTPYTFEIGDHLKPGRNDISIGVFNTLAPYFDAHSPTQFVMEGQNKSGMFGPVRLIAYL